jgi:hypothetical protein
LQETIDNVKLQIAEEQNRIRVIQDENLKIITNNMLDQTSDTLKENAKKIVVAQDKLEELNEQLKKENDTLMKENKEKYDKKRPISARLNALQTMIEKLRRAGYAYRSLGEIFSSAPEPSPVETITPPIDQIPAQIKTPERKDPVLKSTSKQVITYTGALKALEDKCRKLQDLGVKDKTQKLIDFIQKVNRECSISTSSLIDALSQTTLLLDEKLSPKDYSTYAYATFATKGSNSATSYAPKVMRTLGVMMMALGIAVALSGTIIAAVTLGLLTSLTVPIGVIVAGTVIGGLGLTSFAMGALLGVFAPNQRGKGLYSAMDSLQSEIRWQSHV